MNIDAVVMCADPTCGEKLDPILVASGHKVHPFGCKPSVAQADPFADEPTDPAAEITRRVCDVLTDYSHNGIARNTQKALGPSEIGHPCNRHLAYRLMDWPPAGADGDELPSLVGTGAHLIMAEAFRWKNHQLGRERFIVERKLQIRPGLFGSGDCFDTDTHTVLDWKFPGSSKMKEYRRGAISAQYRAQLHLYGLGWENAGYQVTAVADVFLPRGGRMRGRDGACTIREPYNRQLALDTLANLDAVAVSVDVLDVDANPVLLAAIPATPGPWCIYCPFYLPGSTDLARGCPGDTERKPC